MDAVIYCLIAWLWTWIFVLVFNIFFLIYGLIFGMEFSHLRLFFMAIKNYGERTVVEKAKFTPFVIIMMRDENESLRKLVMVEFIAILSAFSIGLFIRSMTVGSYNPVLSSTIAYNIMSVIVIFMELKNLYLCFGKGDEAVIARASIRITTEICKGAQPGETEFPITRVPDKKIPLAKNILTMRYYLFLYYHYFETGEYDQIIPIINAFERSLPEKYKVNLIGVYYELVFYYSSLNFMPETAKRYYSLVEKDLENDGDINARRVLAYYNYYVMGDKDTALKYAEEGLKVREEFPEKGLALMEKNMLENLIKEINKL